MEDEINKQVLIAIQEADVILFVVDVMNGLTDLDTGVAQILRKSGKPVVIVANKSDNFEIGFQAAEFYSLGLGDPFSVSSIMVSGQGTYLNIKGPWLQKRGRRKYFRINPGFLMLADQNQEKPR